MEEINQGSIFFHYPLLKLLTETNHDENENSNVNKKFSEILK